MVSNRATRLGLKTLTLRAPARACTSRDFSRSSNLLCMAALGHWRTWIVFVAESLLVSLICHSPTAVRVAVELSLSLPAPASPCGCNLVASCALVASLAASREILKRSTERWWRFSSLGGGRYATGGVDDRLPLRPRQPCLLSPVQASGPSPPRLPFGMVDGLPQGTGLQSSCYGTTVGRTPRRVTFRSSGRSCRGRNQQRIGTLPPLLS